MLGLTEGKGVGGGSKTQRSVHTAQAHVFVAAQIAPASSSLSPSCARSSAIWPGMRGLGRRTQSVWGSYLGAHPHM